MIWSQPNESKESHVYTVGKNRALKRLIILILILICELWLEAMGVFLQAYLVGSWTKRAKSTFLVLAETKLAVIQAIDLPMIWFAMIPLWRDCNGDSNINVLNFCSALSRVSANMTSLIFSHFLITFGSFSNNWKLIIQIHIGKWLENYSNIQREIKGNFDELFRYTKGNKTWIGY